MIYADQRWVGNHGIGRFARHVLAGLDYSPVRLRSHPAAPFDSWHLARALSKLTPDDVFFSPGYNTPLYCDSRFVFTIHDLSHIFCPENSTLAIKLYYATIVKRACDRAVQIFTVSEFTRRQVVEWSGVLPEKVVNVGCGIDPAYRPEGDSYGLPFPYLLCVSNRKRHKNEFRVVEAFAKAAIDPRMHLVFTGETTADLSRHIEQLQVRARIDFVGLVPESKLPELYRGAKALIFPSLYEGFALPVLESMACGTPVVTSNRTAMPETAADAALLVDPRAVQPIAEAIQQIVSDLKLAEQLRARGLARASQFSWQRTAARVQESLGATGCRVP